MAFFDNWNRMRDWLIAGGSWGLLGIAYADIEGLFKLCALLGSIAASCMLAVSQFYTSRKTKQELEDLKRIAAQATEAAAQSAEVAVKERAHSEELEGRIETTRVETERKDREREN